MGGKKSKPVQRDVSLILNLNLTVVIRSYHLSWSKWWMMCLKYLTRMVQKQLTKMKQ